MKKTNKKQIKNKYVGLRIQENMHKLLKQDAEKEGLNISTKIRQIINLYYNNNKKF